MAHVGPGPAGPPPLGPDGFDWTAWNPDLTVVTEVLEKGLAQSLVRGQIQQNPNPLAGSVHDKLLFLFQHCFHGCSITTTALQRK